LRRRRRPARLRKAIGGADGKFFRAGAAEFSLQIPDDVTIRPRDVDNLADEDLVGAGRDGAVGQRQLRNP
jgi:hypothetical protein